MIDHFAVTWWGHAFTTVELAGTRIAFDPVLTDRLGHLRRLAPSPPPRAGDADLVLISHLHRDHLHLPSLRRMRGGATIVAPRGSRALLSEFGDRLIEVAPGQSTSHGTVTITALPAHHDGRREPWSSHRGPALGFRLEGPEHSVWFPGDTGMFDGLTDPAPVDLALVPVGGWGPSLGPHHLDPVQAVTVLAGVGARWVLPVHAATFWPIGLRRLHPRSFSELFEAPIPRFLEALAASGLESVPLTSGHGVRSVLEG